MSDETPGPGNSMPVQKKPPVFASYKFLLTVCLSSLMISTIASYFFFTRWSESEDLSTRLKIEMNILSQNYSQLKNSFEKLYSDLAVFRDENAKVFTLQSIDSSKHHIVRIYWNPYSRQTFLDNISLPKADSLMEYHLWAIYGGQFIDAGVFVINEANEIQAMKPVVNADAWSVTLDAKGERIIHSMKRVKLIMRK